MSQNNSDNAALYTAEANIVDANLKIAKLELDQSEKDLAISEADLNPTASLSLEKSISKGINFVIFSFSL